MPNQYKNLFLRQSYLDSYDDYKKSLGSNEYLNWDYLILTASNDEQANAYRQQLDYRFENGWLPPLKHFAVLSDIDGKRIGSGGATLNVLKYIRERETSFDNLKLLVIHSGGDSKRVPQYSACGKLFSPIPRVLQDDRRSTLFDEIIISMTSVPLKMNNGMLIYSGDVLLLFNPLQIDICDSDAAAISIKESLETGKNHGVFKRDIDGNVECYLHKQSIDNLNKNGAVDDCGNVNIDTGAVLLSSKVLNSLYSLIDNNEKFKMYVNDTVNLSFYGDFLFPLASKAKLYDYLLQPAESELNESLQNARVVIWNTLNKYRMKLISFSPASFLHLGTNNELMKLVSTDIELYNFLNWNNNINTNSTSTSFSASNSYININASIGNGCYIEDSDIHGDVIIGNNCIISGVTLHHVSIPNDTVIHGLKLTDGKFVVRKYSIYDNPKENKWLGKMIDEPLWTKKLFSSFNNIEEAVEATLFGITGDYSLKSSFENADISAILSWQEKLRDKIKAVKFLDAIDAGKPVHDLFEMKLPDRVIDQIYDLTAEADFSKKIRVHYYLSKITTDKKYENRCFRLICDTVLQSALKGTFYRHDLQIKKHEVLTRLPVRVNWGGGWSDTPPYCLENGGTVLNAAITFNCTLPIEVTIKKTNKNVISLSSTDINAYREFDIVSELQNCNNPGDTFSLHKAALIACGVIPYKENIPVSDICSHLGGGVYLNTRVNNIPKGSGLGTSSILAGACIKGLYEFLGIETTQNDLFNRVLCMEQIMSTGGGWQDQVGGLAHGINMISSNRGLVQKIMSTPVHISKDTIKKLEARFALIYTGQRRLARHLLREVIGKYIGNDINVLEILYKIQQLAVLMRFELEKGNINGFAHLLSEHWELSKKLDCGCTNTCIDQIFISIEDLIEGKMICGAGGGGFLQVVLKENVSIDELRTRIFEVFADSGVDVWKCEFYM